MALEIINTVASWFLKKRISQIEHFMVHPDEIQQQLLKQLIDYSKQTEIGKKYDFTSIRSYEEFASRVPIFHYEDFEPYISRARKGESNIFWPEPIKRSEEHTSELQSRENLVCRLLLEKKKNVTQCK